MAKKKYYLIGGIILLITIVCICIMCILNNKEDVDISEIEHKINIITNDTIFESYTGSFCYKKGVCIDKTGFEDFDYDPITSYFGNKLYISGLNGVIKSVELFNYSRLINHMTKDPEGIKVDYTNEYIITPSIRGTYIFEINATYENKPISYYFLVEINEISGDEVNVQIDIKENTLTDNGFTMVIKNKSDKVIWYKNPYVIEKYDIEHWKRLKPVNEFEFKYSTYEINKNDSIEVKIDWEYGYGKLNGKYRLENSFFYEEDEGFYNFAKYLEFEK